MVVPSALGLGFKSVFHWRHDQVLKCLSLAELVCLTGGVFLPSGLDEF